jgi:hypothetical protein
MSSLIEALKEELYSPDYPGPCKDEISGLETELYDDQKNVERYVWGKTGYELALGNRFNYFPRRIYMQDDDGNIVGEIKGIYDPESKMMVFTPSSDRSTRIHEYVHRAQDKLGILDRYPNWLIEGMATAATEEITGEHQLSYPHETRITKRIVEKHGWNKVLQGKLPGMQN